MYFGIKINFCFKNFFSFTLKKLEKWQFSVSDIKEGQHFVAKIEKLPFIKAGGNDKILSHAKSHLPQINTKATRTFFAKLFGPLFGGPVGLIQSALAALLSI